MRRRQDLLGWIEQEILTNASSQLPRQIEICGEKNASLMEYKNRLCSRMCCLQQEESPQLDKTMALHIFLQT